MKEVELGNVCHFENGDRGKNYPSQSAFVEIGIPFISAKDLENNLIKHDNLNYISEETYNKLGSGKLQPNDILFCLRGSLGKFAINKDGLNGGIASSLVLLRAKEDLQINYLKHYLNSPRMKRLITKSDNGSSQPNLSGANVKKFPIPLPPLTQQKKIAAILDAADGYRQKTKALIGKYDELTQSLFLDMFGDPVGNPKGLPTEQLGNLCDFYSGRAWKKGELGDKGYKLVRISNLHKPSFPYWLYDGEMIEKHKVEQGDLLFSWAGVQASIDAYIYEGEVAMINQHIYNIKPKRSDINKLYLFNLLQLHLENLRKSLGGGVGQFHLKKSDITSIKVLIPDSNSMEKYMQSLNSIKNQKAKAQESLAKAEDLFNSLLQKAFKGELTN